ncbi:hypothetical protein ElyMa_002453100 [Elysia marginata]|uniref:Reverse transcriptase domain-containing protein n=1 Tax=Elysia marginata TaxID=1093978 RepID=A0AAV4GJN8_9GAST|nr:hypothetical protein ElyMa_002453100 [Elysia marginata]
MYRKVRNNAKSVSQKCENDYWLRLCGDIQSAADGGNTRAMFEEMKKTSGPSIIKVAPLKSTTRLQHLQEKCREQRRPLYLVFIDFTKAFGFVNRTGLSMLMPITGFSLKLLRMTRSFHDGMMGTVQYDDSSSDQPFPNQERCEARMRPSTYAIQHLFLPTPALRLPRMSRWHVLRHQTRWQPFQPIASQGKDKGASSAHQRDAALATHSEEALQRLTSFLATHSEESLQQLISCFTDACREFSLTISLKKTNIIGQHVDTTPTIFIDEQILDVANKFTYLGSTISNNLSLDAD